MGGADGEGGQGSEQQAAGRGGVGRKPLIGFQLDHVHPDRLDDPIAADGGADAHDEGTEDHQPDRDLEGLDIPAAVGKENPQHEDAHEFLAVLRTVHEGHGGTAADLCPAEKAGGFPPFHSFADKRGDFGHQPAGPESEHGGEDQAPYDVHPFLSVDPCRAAHRDRGAREPGDERVAFTRGDPEIPGRHRPDDNGEQRRAERHQSLMGIVAEIHHVVDGHCHSRGNQGHDQYAQKVEHRRHQNGGPGSHGPGGNTGGDGVGRVRPAVDKDNPQG